MKNATDSQTATAPAVACSDLLAALRELSESAHKVCEPIFTASDGGDMWCAMRHKPDATESVERLKAAIQSANKIVAANGKSCASAAEK